MILEWIVLYVTLAKVSMFRIDHFGDSSAVPKRIAVAGIIAKEAKTVDSRSDVPLAAVLETLDPDPENSDSDSDWYNTYYMTAGTIDRKTQNAHPRSHVYTLTNGTTRHLREIFIGRCWEYQYRRNFDEHKELDCDRLWVLFLNAFAYRQPCDAQAVRYVPFLARVDEEIPENKGLLWSGTRELAHKYSDFFYNKRFTTLEDTLSGYLLTGLTWCGSKQYPGVNYTKCPYECAIQAPYWAMANRRFAEKLKGVVHILLNGTRQHLIDRKIYPAYMKYRYYLGPYMVPHFNPKKIKEVRIIVAHTLHLNPLESCGESSVKELYHDIQARGIPVTCFDDPSVIKHILCVDEPKLRECESLLPMD